MPIGTLIKISESGEMKKDIYFDKQNKSFIQELRENLTPEIRKRISKHINKVLEAKDKW